MKRFNVVIPKDDGGVELYAMKEWLRQHREHVPEGLDPTASASHQLRSGLRKSGWSIQETDTEVRLMIPGAQNLQGSVDAVLGDQAGEEDEEQPEAVFALEYQLRDFIAQNLGRILVEGKRLRLYMDAAGREGVEFPMAVGPIDILAVDEDEAFVVFELKRARSPDHAIGQLTRYMGWVKETIGKDREVRGVIVAKSIAEGLRYSISVIRDVSLFEYGVSFYLTPVGK